jgi:diguanylate cyclase (GGDEF)-like protein/PAS domain S-box-containing protein
MVRIEAVATAAGSSHDAAAGSSHDAASLALALLAAAGLAMCVVLLRRARRDRRELHALRSELAHRQHTFAAMSDAVPAGIFRTDAEGNLTFVNRRMAEMSGHPDGVTSIFNAPIDDADRERLLALWTEANRTRQPMSTQIRLRRPDGELRWVDIESRPLDGHDGTPLGWVGWAWDVTDQLSNLTRVTRLSEILDATPDLVIMHDRAGRLMHANRAARERYGLPATGPFPPIDATDLYAPYERQRILTEALPVAERDGVWAGELDLQLSDGTQVPVSQVLLAHRRDDGAIDYYSSITRDLSEQRMFEAQLARAKWYDPATALPNRAFFLDAVEVGLERCSHRNTRLAVLLADIDRFKLVNDSLGHAAGDEMLRSVTERLRLAAGPAALLARFGSDEFCLLLEDVTDDQQPVRLAERIADQLAAPITVGDHSVFVTISTGIAVSTAGGRTSPEALLRDADVALHRAKERGRARSELFVEDLRHHAVNQLRTASDLHRALDGKEFRVVYQPEVDLRTGHIMAVEALVRWHHPERGLVPPAEFIPLAEQTGLIAGIGNWVLETAIEQAARWSTARWNRTGLLVWVNLSARQLSDAGLVDLVASLLRKHGVAAQQLGLEITETALLDDAEVAVDALTALHALGVRLAVDDFGTGYSSLSYLKRLPVDAVKVDRSFVDGLAQGGDDSAIVAAVAGMARALRLTTIAEGVEEIGQLHALRRLGCDLAQGYFFTTPQPPSHITALLEVDRGAGVFAYDEPLSTGISAALPQQRGAQLARMLPDQTTG